MMNVYSSIFSFIEYPLSFVNNVSCDLSEVTNEILIANVTCTNIMQ
jgi:hypothetical protein